MSYRLVSASGNTITAGPLIAMQFASCDYPGSFVLREVRRRAIEMASDEMEQVDLRGLLKKYIDHVGEIEGSTCIGAINANGTSRSGINFTPDELATLIELESK